ncbi:glycosylhydrolase family 18-6 [Colletotrichum salicis]|uniref:Glycosylhydrolase family 18-6 n=1 Tax=Colletotrichum salicis TaxID=1209931 RepID=A0A135UXC9_9PEZI|nr:glycosylhydrolase family 18-6 [Colletotrichum salicis]
MKTTGACYNGKPYSLASPDGDACECFDGGCLDNRFSAPKSVGKLGDSFGGVTEEDLIAGAVRTYLANIDDEGVQDDLLDVDVTRSGFIRIFVCGAERAFQIWEGTTKDVARGFTENYPCDEPPGRDNCGVSSIEDQTSGASPGASDCRQIIKNIEADGSTEWTIQTLGERFSTGFLSWAENGLAELLPSCASANTLDNAADERDMTRQYMYNLHVEH